MCSCILLNPKFACCCHRILALLKSMERAQLVIWIHSLTLILMSRRDLGVFRICKRDVTAPKEFEFQTAKINHQNPPVELFSKGSKENRWESCQEGQNVRRDIQDTHQGKQILNVASSVAGELGPGNAMSRFDLDTLK
ncbi:uncharacterized protein LOC141641686 [Silene latifolia]|uniref:uncharacterized protein LOC141641686 n=1 Tax=Silene latifolia TaxID=37657 RepID=UPI003D77FC9E